MTKLSDVRFTVRAVGSKKECLMTMEEILALVGKFEVLDSRGNVVMRIDQ